MHHHRNAEENRTFFPTEPYRYLWYRHGGCSCILYAIALLYTRLFEGEFAFSDALVAIPIYALIVLTVQLIWNFSSMAESFTPSGGRQNLGYLVWLFSSTMIVGVMGHPHWLDIPYLSLEIYVFLIGCIWLTILHVASYIHPTKWIVISPLHKDRINKRRIVSNDTHILHIRFLADCRIEVCQPLNIVLPIQTSPLNTKGRQACLIMLVAERLVPLSTLLTPQFRHEEGVIVMRSDKELVERIVNDQNMTLIRNSGITPSWMPSIEVSGTSIGIQGNIVFKIESIIPNVGRAHSPV